VDVRPEDVDGLKEEVKKVKDAVVDAEEGVKHIIGPKTVIEVAGGIADVTNKGVETAATIYDLWQPLFEKVSIFLEIVEDIAEVSQLETLIPL
jgi:hypothetical protein